MIRVEDEREPNSDETISVKMTQQAEMSSGVLTG